MTTYIKNYSMSTDTMNTPKNNNSNTHYNQGDLNSAQLAVTITHNGSTMDLSTATAVQIFFLRPDGQVVSQDLNNGISFVSATQGQINIALNSQTLAAAGTVQCEPHITYPNNQVLVAERFSFTVEGTLLSNIQSQNSYQTLMAMQNVASVSNLPTASSANRFALYAVQGVVGVTEVDSLTINAAPTASGNVTVTLNGVATNVAVTNGTDEVDTLTITAGATTTGNITITLNGVATGVTVSAGDTTGTIGDKIRAATFTGWTVGGTSGSATVTFTKNSVGTNTAPTFTDSGSTGTTASFAVTTAGANPDTTSTVATKIGNTAFSGWTTSVNGSTVTFTASATGAKTAPSYSAGSTGASGTMSVSTAGVTSVADGVYMCKKLSTDSYDWVQIA